MTLDSTRPLALVTGASSGIGEAYAHQLAQKGYDLILVARRRERLEALARQLETEYQAKSEVLEADLGTPQGVSKVTERMNAVKLDLLVNNAGFAHYAPVAQSPVHELEDMILLNVLALVQLTRAVLPGMLERGRGSVIEISSGLAFLPPPAANRATYSGTKAFIINFTRALAEEVQGTGVRVQVLVPGLIRTEFHDRSGTDLERFPPQMVMDPFELVRASLVGLERGETVCIPALTDPAALEQFWQAQGELAMSFVRNGQIAERYRQE